uniref:Putative ovule protein n=1 Tax=Solanum chacoense TaxID=4108 RepID=A0A0V0GNX1_SOLCH
MGRIGIGAPIQSIVTMASLSGEQLGTCGTSWSEILLSRWAMVARFSSGRALYWSGAFVALLS